MKAEKLFSMGIPTTLCVDVLSTWWEKKEQDSGSKKNYPLKSFLEEERLSNLGR